MPVQCLEKFQVQCFFKEYGLQIFRDTLHWPPFFCLVFLGEQKNEDRR